MDKTALYILIVMCLLCWISQKDLCTTYEIDETFNVTVCNQFATKDIIKAFQIIRKYIIIFFFVILLFIDCWECKQQSVKPQEVQMTGVRVLMKRRGDWRAMRAAECASYCPEWTSDATEPVARWEERAGPHRAAGRVIFFIFFIYFFFTVCAASCKRHVYRIPHQRYRLVWVFISDAALPLCIFFRFLF